MSKTTIPTGGITADAINATLIADDAISEEHIDATVITASTALAAAPADTDEFLISDAGVIKRIDYSLIKGGNTPYFAMSRNSDQAISDNTQTQVNFDNSIMDSDSAITLASTSGFTVPSGKGGKYLLGFSAMLSSGANNNANDLNIIPKITPSGGSASAILEIELNGHNGWGRGATVNNHGIFTLAAGDLLQMFATIDTVNGGDGTISGSAAKTYMYGFKIG